MLTTYRSVIRNQYEAAFRTIQFCIDQCTDDAWHQRVCNHLISQTFFHALFFGDLYLGPNPDVVSDQAFHYQHEENFAGYEELKDRISVKRYSREFIQSYLDHCRAKAHELIEGITESELQEPSGFDWINGTTAEVHVYNIRHLQHHAAQISMRLRLDHQVDIPWVKSGWEG